MAETEQEAMNKQGVLPYVVETIKQSDGITAWAGLPLVLETMRALGLDQVIGEHVRARERKRGYSEARKIEALVMLMASGGDCIEDHYCPNVADITAYKPLDLSN